MTGRDQGGARSQPVYQLGRCVCGHLSGFHKPGTGGRGACSASTCDCRRLRTEEDDHG